MEIINYDTLLEKYAGIAFEKQYSLSEIIGNNDWQIDMESGLISFGEGLNFPIQILGSYAFDSGTWLWGWANEASDIPSHLLQEANELKQLGENFNIEFLSMPEYKMEPTDVHSLGLIASGKFASSAYYAGNYGSGILLATLKGQLIEEVKYNENARILSVFTELISVFTVNHKRTFENYLLSKGYILQETGHSLAAEKGGNIITAEFDEKNRLAKINGEIKNNI